MDRKGPKKRKGEGRDEKWMRLKASVGRQMQTEREVMKGWWSRGPESGVVP